MPDTPKNLEDLVRLFGWDNMEMFHEMVRPDQHIEHEEDEDPAETPGEVTLTPEHERAIVEGLERYFGRKPT